MKIGAQSGDFHFLFKKGTSPEDMAEQVKYETERQLMLLFTYLVRTIVNGGVVPSVDNPLQMTLELHQDNLDFKFVLFTDREYK